jgi:hypothetical protein
VGVAGSAAGVDACSVGSAAADVASDVAPDVAPDVASDVAADVAPVGSVASSVGDGVAVGEAVTSADAGSGAGEELLTVVMATADVLRATAATPTAASLALAVRNVSRVLSTAGCLSVDGGVTLCLDRVVTPPVRPPG